MAKQLTKTATADYYDMFAKAGVVLKLMVREAIKEKRQEEIARTIAAVVKNALPQSLQLKVLKELRALLAAPREIETK